jgi:hypothetical protein
MSTSAYLSPRADVKTLDLSKVTDKGLLIKYVLWPFGGKCTVGISVTPNARVDYVQFCTRLGVRNHLQYAQLLYECLSAVKTLDKYVDKETRDEIGQLLPSQIGTVSYISVEGLLVFVYLYLTNTKAADRGKILIDDMQLQMLVDDIPGSDGYNSIYQKWYPLMKLMCFSNLHAPIPPVSNDPPLVCKHGTPFNPQSGPFIWNEHVASTLNWASSMWQEHRKQHTTQDLTRQQKMKYDILSSMVKLPSRRLEPDAIKKNVHKCRLFDGIYKALLFSVKGSQPNRNFLMCGPPGTGKTHAARMVADNMGLSFIAVKSSDILMKYVGEDGKQLAALFMVAKARQPVILLIDECETLFRSRTGDDSTTTRDVTNELLQYLGDTTDTNCGVCVVACTNTATDLLDSAVKSRFSVINVAPPTRMERYELWRTMLTEKHFIVSGLERRGSLLRLAACLITDIRLIKKAVYRAHIKTCMHSLPLDINDEQCAVWKQLQEISHLT